MEASPVAGHCARLFEDLCGYIFICIAAQIKFRSTLLPAERLETASERRMSDIAHQGNSRTRGVSGWCVRVPSSLVLSVAQKVHDRMNYQ